LNFDIEDYFDDYQLLGEVEQDTEKNVGKEIVKELWNEIKNLNGSNFARNLDSFEDYDDIEISLSENFLINEYILSTFQKNVDVDIRDFSGKYRDERKSVFPEREVEYILTGIQGKNFSKTNVMGRIFLIRQGLNIVHILTSQEKMKVIEEIGELSASVFLPAGPVAMILVINGWSALESIKDIKLLYSGKGIPLIKSDEEWLTDIDIGNRKIINKTSCFENYEDKNFDELYYNDYLRMLLFFSKGEIKLSRILNVIEENYSDKSGYNINLSNYSVSHEIKGWYDIEPMFSNKEFCRSFEVNGRY